MLGIIGYELQAQIHRSARTLVYRARRESDGLPVVLKLMAEEYPSFEDATRFKREYEIGRRVSGEGAVVVLALEPVRRNWAIVMEDRGALTLRAILEERRLPLEEALRLGIRLAAALAAVHRQNVIHKDINPSNIVIEPAREEVRLIDFGLASLMARENPTLLSPNLLEGTLRYISPEQTGRMNRAIDSRSDLYSLGVTLYELLTGRVPFTSADPVELVHLHIAQRPVSPHELEPAIPRPLSDVVMKLLAKTAEDRYQSALGVQSDLEDCLEAWSSGARGVELGLPDFLPGRNDISSRFQLPQKLYGRAAQIEELLKALDRAARGRAELALVGGDSGLGKSVLVHEIQRPVLDRRVNFVSGKFDQLQRDIPYAPLIHGFTDFVRHLLTLSEAQLAPWRQRLSEALGGNGQVVIDVLPVLEQLLGPQPPVPELSSQEAQHRFTLVFQRFVMALVSGQHPLVLFLDDLQWADLPSLQLLQALLLEPRIQHLLIVGAYRESDVSSAHPLRLLLEALAKEGVPLTPLTLAPLEFEHVVQLVSDTFRCDPGRSAPLARLLWERSGGNPFFIGQLLRALYEDRLIDFDPDAAQWAWDVEVIRARGLTESVIELMTRKLQKLPEATQRVLELAACMGNRFPLASLAIVHERLPAEVAARLYPAIEEGLILPMDDRWRLVEQGGAADATYRFLHDRVQQAAYSLIPEGTRAQLHLKIARMLLASLTPEQLEERLIDVVHQLNLGSSLVTGEEERYEVARLNLLAGRKAKASAAFEPALRYFSTGLWLLPEDAWSQRYPLCLELHLEAMDAEYLNSRSEQGEALSELVLSKSRDVLEKLKVYNTRITFASVRKDVNRALEEAYRALQLLGLELRRSVALPAFLEALSSVQKLTAGQSQEALLSLPPMTDPRWLAACQVTVPVTSAAYMSNALDSCFISLEMVKLCLLHGNAPEAPYFYSVYGLALTAIVDDLDAGAVYREIALTLLERLGAKQLKCKVYLITTAFILHWKKHLRETFTPLREAIQAGLDSGDLEFTAYSAAYLSTHVFCSGLPLEEVLQENDRYLDQMKRLKLEMGSHAIRAVRQASLNLMGQSAEPTRMVGESFDEEEELLAAMTSGFISGLARIYLMKIILACFFRDAKLAVAMTEAREPYMSTALGNVAHLEQNFFGSLALLSACGGASEPDRARYLARVEKNQEKLKRWAEHAPMNSLHRYQLVEAELARVRGDFLNAARLYEEAAGGARKNRYLNHEALCHELAGEFFLSIGRERLAHDSLRDAAAAYRRWGAEAKVAQLEKRYPEVFMRKQAPVEDKSQTAGSISSNDTSGPLLDLATVVKAAQAVSGEILLEPLLERLMRILIENAGAQRGALVLVRDDRLLIEAVQEVRSASFARLSVPLEGCTLLSEAIVQFVARTRENVVLDNASAEGLFSRDPYVVQHRLRSVLCAPLINQGRLMAILYLENNYMAGVFTADRLEVLRLLSAQAALSLENALLYAQQEEYSHTLEQRVEARTRELQAKNEELSRAMSQLRDTQKQLVAQEKLASLGALTAGIAHELKNPLNFISNFAELSAEYADELVKDLASPQTRMPAEAQREVLLQLHQSVMKIRDHGNRATQIINGMLMHSREQPGTRSPADLNAVLAESLNLGYRGFCTKVPGFEASIQTDYDPGVPEVDMVAPELSRVFINAVDNACYALQRKKSAAREEFSPCLRVSTRDLGERVEVRIRDNGMGIPEPLLGKVFNPFFTTKPAGEGTGLGLSLSHNIVVEGHRGSMRVESAEGEFTELIIELPKRAPTV
ncbi:MAG: AAA family ATPase [Hyalangium sp.]|uniref:trifunctional serine/threonine-protein kinase/ATP-binding protein/sensor histidine kinase n=1 Tax=Hyalangium sp. TaxID=2028555 RepID=UPI003899C764